MSSLKLNKTNLVVGTWNRLDRVVGAWVTNTRKIVAYATFEGGNRLPSGGPYLSSRLV